MTQSAQQRWPVRRLLVLGILFHLVYIGTVFDCYFTSPVVHGMVGYSPLSHPAKRLVLVVGDGLRADFVFSANATALVPGAPEVVAPYLRAIIEERGAWGVSHTRVPTESRPGHVALIAGMYEDVSAVTKGWKTNPVDFDSVFNQSSHTFSFGSPDILPMFERGAVPGRVATWMYDEEEEDFTKDATELDIWVYNRLEDLFRNATSNPVLDAQLREDRVIFFLHLLGLDTTGHAYRPHSKEYMNNLAVVDEIIRKTEDLLAGFYGDNKTSFVFTADHGMSRIGNHGDGDPDNTRTPLIAWGSGVRKPILSSDNGPTDEYSAPWALHHIVRRDVQQADVASLMSALLGTALPVNSVGVLPDIDPTKYGYLDLGEEEIVQLGRLNAKAILEHYRVKHELKQRHALHYTPFSAIDHRHPSGFPAFAQVQDIEADIASQEFYTARMKLIRLLEIALEGLRYLETYDRTLIQCMVAFAYTGWMAFCASTLLVPAKFPSQQILSVSHSPVISCAFASALIALWVASFAQHSPWTLYIYAVFPVYFWHETTCAIWQACETIQRTNSTHLLYTGLMVILVGGVLESMVLAYTSRALWSIGFIAIGLLWPLTWRRDVRLLNKGLWLQWTVSCLATAIFPLLSVSPSEDLLSILIGGACMLIIGCFGIQLLPQHTNCRRSEIQLMLIALAMAVTSLSVQSLQAKKGLPLLYQLFGWFIFLSAPISLCFLSPDPSEDAKLLQYFLALGPCFVILSVKVEGLFYVAYCATLWLWARVEATVRTPAPTAPSGRWNPGKLRADDVRIALFFLFFVQVGFFGTGNVASISSFYLEPVYRLVPVFNPFLMATLLIFKILAPYVMLSACFAVLNARLRMPPFTFFLIALALTDGMTLTFFFKVTDTGSWLEIGQSISHFCITSLLLVFSAGIAALGDRLMVLREDKVHTE